MKTKKIKKVPITQAIRDRVFYEFIWPSTLYAGVPIKFYEGEGKRGAFALMVEDWNGNQKFFDRFFDFTQNEIGVVEEEKKSYRLMKNKGQGAAILLTFSRRENWSPKDRKITMDGGKVYQTILSDLDQRPLGALIGLELGGAFEFKGITFWLTPQGHPVITSRCFKRQA